MEKLYKHVINDPLYSNSLYTMASTFISAGLGFIFWVVIARIFTTNAVGIATALIAVLTLIVNFSDIGLNIGLLRFLPQAKNRNELISTALLIVGGVTLLVAICFIFATPLVSKDLVFLRQNSLFFLTFIVLVIFAAWNTLFDSIFKSFRAARYVLVRNVLLSIVKLALPFALLFLGSYGIFLSVGIATMVACLVGMVVIWREFAFHFQPLRYKTFIREIGFFSVTSYLASFFFQLPMLLLPIIIIHRLSASFVAYYYMDAMIFNFLVVIPVSVTQMLLAEGSYNSKQLHQHLRKSIRIISSLLLPAVIILVFFGKYILFMFGRQYAANAVSFLQLMSISSVCMSVVLLGSAMLRVKHKIKQLVAASFIGCCLIVGFCWAFVGNGLTGIGWGWLIGEALTSIIFLFLLAKELRSNNVYEVAKEDLRTNFRKFWKELLKEESYDE